MVKNRVKTRKTGLKYITSTPSGEKIVSMIEYRGKIFIATGSDIYMLIKNKLAPLQVNGVTWRDVVKANKT